jgi:23S rRNA-/tRNA-specific pseudouridylate synthase
MNRFPRQFASRTPGAVQRAFLSSTASKSSLWPPNPSLPLPTVLFSNNHLLVVNKPPGWHSAPSADAPIDLLDNDKASRPDGRAASTKCLLSHLQRRKLGGGSQRTFLAPVHRLDQPCSGVQLYAKTSRAASRIQRHWREIAHKSYLAVLASPQALEALMQQASPSTTDINVSASQVDDAAVGTDDAQWYELKGYLERRRTAKHPLSNESSDATRGWSVKMIPVLFQTNESDLNSYSDDGRYRLCSIHLQVVCPDRGMVRVATRDGARHVIRALLSSHGAPLAGDVRYGDIVGASGRSAVTALLPLPDKSVALHAERVEIVPPSGASGTASFFHALRGPHVAPIPPPWGGWFGFSSDATNL